MDIQKTLGSLRRFFSSGKTLSAEYRLNALANLEKAIRAREEEILAALARDLGKSRTEGYMTELGMVYSELSYMRRHVKKLMRPVRAKTPTAQLPAKSFSLPCPYGTALIVSPWNYPFQLTMVPLVDCIAAGNCALVKPSASAAETAKIIGTILKEAFPPEYVSVAEGDRKENADLFRQKYDVVFFTGGKETGRRVAQCAAENLTPAVLELGGKSPCIVAEDADIRLSARRIAFGKLLNSGQTCVAPDYLLVHQNVKGPLVDRIRHWIDVFYGPDPKESPHFGRLVNESAYRRVASYLTDGSLLAGGETDPAQRYIAPTLLDLGTPTDSVPVMQAEIFGPILPVMEYVHLDQAIEFVNRHEKPLALYYFGAPRTGREVLRRTSSGGACINDTILHISNDHLPFGGVGRSGMGRYHGKASFETFSNRRSVLISLRNSDLPFKYPPYKYFKLIRKLLHL